MEYAGRFSDPDSRFADPRSTPSFAMQRLTQLYRVGRWLVVMGMAAVILPDGLIEWPQPRPAPAPAPTAPELETDVGDATKEQMTPAGTPPPKPITQRPTPTGQCPEGMVYVSGDFCPGLAHTCKHYLDEKKDRCGDFYETSRCLGPTIKKKFCIDTYEYPNQLGEKPLLSLDWDAARQLCEAADKRLCTADEWTLSCEGHGRLPYPYGYARDKEACNIDKPYISPDDRAYANPEKRAAEVARLDQREASGSRESCVSPFGVFDMTGNVDEWVDYERGSFTQAPYRSGLKGGYWGPVRNRCRPITATHNRWHTGYQVGLRCCRDPDVRPPKEAQPASPPPKERAPKKKSQPRAQTP